MEKKYKHLIIGGLLLATSTTDTFSNVQVSSSESYSQSVQKTQFGTELISLDIDTTSKGYSESIDWDSLSEIADYLEFKLSKLKEISNFNIEEFDDEVCVNIIAKDKESKKAIYSFFDNQSDLLNSKVIAFIS